MLGGRHRIAEGRIHDDDPARGSGGEVDIVDADAGAADRLETRRGREQRLVHTGGRAHREPVIGADARRQRVGRETRGDIGGDAPGLEHGDRAVAQRIGDQDAGHGGAALAQESHRRSQAQSSQGNSAARSLVSTVGPAHSRKPGGAAR